MIGRVLVMKTLLILSVLIGLGLCAQEDVQGQELPRSTPSPKNDIDRALDTFNAFRLAVSLQNWEPAAIHCVELGGNRTTFPVTPVLPAATDKFRDLIPAELRDPSRKVSVYSVGGNSWSMYLKISAVGGQLSPEER